MKLRKYSMITVYNSNSNIFSRCRRQENRMDIVAIEKSSNMYSFFFFARDSKMSKWNPSMTLLPPTIQSTETFELSFFKNSFF